MSRFCDKCGAELKNNAKFCEKCGSEVKTINTQSNIGTNNYMGEIICPNCGQTTPGSQPKCINCGSEFENNTTAVIVGYVVTFLLGIFGLIPAIYLLTRNSGKAKTQGILLIGLSILQIILNLSIGWISYLIILMLMIVGIFLWYNDYSIF